MKSILDFWAPWCQPCKQLKPIIESLEEEYPDVSFVKINTDEDQEMVDKYEIMSIPTLIVQNDGETVTRLTGSEITKDAIIAAIC